MTYRLTFAAAFAALLLATSGSQVQVIAGDGITYPSVTGFAPVISAPETATTYSSHYAAPTAATPSNVTVAPYSYYAAPPGTHARTYVGYGASDIFPFYGQPYGHPGDRWSWTSMSSYPSSTLVRYYYPPVP